MESNINKARRRPVCVNIGTYARKKQEQNKVSVEDLIRAVRPDNSDVNARNTINNFLEKNYLPTYYSYFMSICEALGVEETELKKWEKEEPAYLFAYWNELKPDAPDIKYISALIREKNERFSIYELSDLTGLQNASISRAEYGTTMIKYDTFESFCRVYGEKPIDVLNEFAAFPDCVKATKLIPQYINNGMELAEVTREEAPEELGYTKERFERLFLGKAQFFVDDIRRISIRFGLSAESLYDLVYRAYLNGTSASFKEATKTGHIQDGERRITDLSNILLKYKRVTDKKFSVETHTLLTLMYLILLSGGTDKYRMEVMYYIEHLNDKGPLYKKFVKMEPGWDKLNGFELFRAVREERDLSHAQIGKMIGSSSSHTIKVCSGNSRFIPTLVDKASEAVQLSSSVLLEAYLNSEDAERDEASVWDVITTVQATIIWNMDGLTVRTNTLSMIFRILYNKKLSAKQKYNEIKKLTFE